MKQCACGSTKVENSELSLCASCNRARRKAEAQATIGKAKVQARGLQRKTPLRSSAKPLKQQTSKTAARDAKIAANKRKRMQEVKWCETCGKTGCFLTWSHVLSVKQYEQFAEEYENGLLECMECHTEWEHGSYEDKQKQKTWHIKKEIILKLYPKHLEKLGLKQRRK